MLYLHILLISRHETDTAEEVYLEPFPNIYDQDFLRK